MTILFMLLRMLESILIEVIIN